MAVSKPTTRPSIPPPLLSNVLVYRGGKARTKFTDLVLSPVPSFSFSLEFRIEGIAGTELWFAFSEHGRLVGNTVNVHLNDPRNLFLASLRLGGLGLLVHVRHRGRQV